MKLPQLPALHFEWPDHVVEDWKRILADADKLEQKAGGGDVFEAMCKRLRTAVNLNDLTDLFKALDKRLGARALTWLWNNESDILKKSCRVSVVNELLQAQQPRLTRTTFLQLCQLYFQEFDQLKLLDENLFECIEAAIQAQVLKMSPAPRTGFTQDPITSIQNNVDWLINLEGPARFAEKVRESGVELEGRFKDLGLVGYDSGRYGEICRANYYINTLKGVELGQWDPVFDELLKPSVSKAPFKDGKRIGHAALEILIDRAGAEITEAWQDFVIGIAGDPRIHSSAHGYQEWWKPLGDARIEKVRGWLSREDLKLFLQALEQYGVESGKADLKRMFPARKRFLEGLYNQKLIRNTRLMLGRSAEGVVKRLLGNEIKTNFATLEGQLSDKAIIYLDCGDFYLVEGSHSFRIWVYLAPPGKMVTSYDFSSFSHGDLTHTTPAQYQAMYQLPYEAVTHNGPWQSKVIDFLAEHGIEVDVESLLTPVEYRGYLARYGVPVVKSTKVQVPSPSELPGHLEKRPPRQAPERPVSRSRNVFGQNRQNSAISQFLHRKVAASEARQSVVGSPERPREKQRGNIDHLSSQHKEVLRYLANDPNTRARYVATLLNIPLKKLSAMFFGPLAPYVRRKDDETWVIAPEYRDKFK